jgi:hypothetical protein
MDRLLVSNNLYIIIGESLFVKVSVVDGHWSSFVIAIPYSLMILLLIDCLP